MRSGLHILLFCLFLGLVLSCIDTKNYNKIYCDERFAELQFTCIDTAEISNPVWLDSLKLRSSRGFDLSAFSFLTPRVPTTNQVAAYGYYNDQYKDSLYRLIDLGDANHNRMEEFSFDTVYCKGWVADQLLIDTFMILSSNICHVYRHSGPARFIYTPPPLH